MASDVIFDEVVDVFNKIRRTSNVKSKQATFQKNFESWKEKCSDPSDMFVIIRFFVSDYERFRKFDMGPTKLASFMAKTFHDVRADYVSTISKDASTAARQLAEKISEEYRTENDESTVVTVSELNEILDFLAAGPMDDGNKRDKMSKLVKRCSEDELEWIFNVILKNVESALGAPSNRILDWISPSACAIWDQTHDLKAVLKGKLVENKGTNELGETNDDDDEHLFKIWTPMLLQKQKRGDWYANIEKFGGQKFFLQTKFDGENVLLHKKGNEYRWFTRNNNDFSKEYGDSSMAIGKLSSRIHSFFNKECESAIFNCELMLWDKKTKKLCRHNDASTTSDAQVLSFRHVKPDDNQQLTVVLFDLLYLNGKPFFGAPLHQRLEMLKIAPLKKEREDTIFVAKHEEGSKKEDIQQFFEIAMANNEEGIVVKRTDSVYVKGQRSASNGWFKLKPSASKDCDLDLALVAVHPGAGRNGKTLYRFAAFDEKTQDYKLCLSCSYGLSDTVREAIRFEYGQLLEEAPEELTFYGKRPKNIARGDGGYIDFERWQVIKITSNGVRNGKLVDPVMREWRLDKPVEQVNTWEEFSDYATALQECKLGDNVDSDEEDSEDKKPDTLKVERITRKAIHQSAPVRLKRAKLESSLTGIEVAVLQGTSETIRRKCEEILKHFDATVVKGITPSTKLCIATAPKSTHPKTAQAIASNSCTVLKPAWLERCNKDDLIQAWLPSDVFHAIEGGFEIQE
ncbi:DNA ligase IV [Caenorhabditis elegans]|uniref:DNA ligase IV n=1 Tax=Caenorhabditis elegans TaxID=6239 RepID=Q95YE6_CAEEL|nr:DNA ligase IV [Caenorhabditis elegans]CCD63588.2 DNA ligase IV [Caenorhabditis elegans]